MDVRLIYNHIEHHSAHSGYDHLAAHVTGRPWTPGRMFQLAKKVPEGWRKKIPTDDVTRWYGGEKVDRDLAIAFRNAVLPSHTLYHFFYPENDLRVCSRWRWRWNNKVVASFHQPPEFLDKHVADKGYLRGLDAIVVMAESQIDYMVQFLPRKRVFCVPHGVYTDFWKPSPELQRWDEPTFLFAGYWLRDFATTTAAIKRAAQIGLPARFRIVTLPERRHLVEGLPNTTVMSRISEEQLLEEYRRAHALFLPVDYATANNVILESMSCGTGIISTRIGGVPEYVTPDAGILLEPKNVDQAVEALALLCRDRGRVEAMGKAARERAHAYSWPAMGRLQNDVYRKVLSGRF